METKLGYLYNKCLNCTQVCLPSIYCAQDSELKKSVIYLTDEVAILLSPPDLCKDCCDIPSEACLKTCCVTGYITGPRCILKCMLKT